MGRKSDKVDKICSFTVLSKLVILPHLSFITAEMISLLIAQPTISQKWFNQTRQALCYLSIYVITDKSKFNLNVCITDIWCLINISPIHRVRIKVENNRLNDYTCTCNRFEHYIFRVKSNHVYVYAFLINNLKRHHNELNWQRLI